MGCLQMVRVILQAEQFEMSVGRREPATLVPVFHTDLGTCGLPTPNVISSSGHTALHPGQ